MKFKKTKSDDWHTFSMISDCGNHRLEIMPTIFGNRIRLYEAPAFQYTPIDWCVGKNQKLAERLMGLIIHYLKDRRDIGKLAWYPSSNTKPIHNDPEFLDSVLKLANGKFKPYKLPIKL